MLPDGGDRLAERPPGATLSPPAAPPAVRHVLTILAVERLDEAVGFYRAAFGWSQPVVAPVYAEFVLPGGQRLGLYERTAFGRNTGGEVPAATPPGALAPTELYLHCDDLPGTIERLRAAGARELSPLATRAWGDEAAYFADPAGNVLAVARPLTLLAGG